MLFLGCVFIVVEVLDSGEGWELGNMDAIGLVP